MITAMLFFLAIATQAQVSVNVNLGSQPNWGPVGYTEVQYYYLPDIQAYYDIPSSRFIYLRNGSWFRSASLPPQYRGYDLYSGYKVVLTDYRGRTPYMYFKNHKVKYYKGYKGKPQKAIGMRSGNSGNGNNKMSHSNGGKKSHGNGHGNGKGKDK